MIAPDHYYDGETPEWDELMRALDAQDYPYDASGSDEGTDYIDLHTPGGRYPTIEQARDREGQQIGWTIRFDVEDEEPRTYTVATIAELIDLIEAN
jgi:hypothetical protein